MSFCKIHTRNLVLKSTIFFCYKTLPRRHVEPKMISFNFNHPTSFLELKITRQIKSNSFERRKRRLHFAFIPNTLHFKIFTTVKKIKFIYLLFPKKKHSDSFAASKAFALQNYVLVIIIISSVSSFVSKGIKKNKTFSVLLFTRKSRLKEKRILRAQ